MDQLPRALSRYLYITYTLGSIVAATTFYLNPTLSGDSVAFLVFLTLSIVINSVPSRYTFTKTMYITTTVDIAAAWVLSPIHVIIIIAVGNIVHSRGRKAWYKLLFNIAYHVISIGITAFILFYFDKTLLLETPSHFFKILLSCAIYITLTMIFMGLVTTFSDPNQDYSYHQIKNNLLDSFTLIDIILFVYGIVLGSLWFVSPYIFVLGVGPVFAMQWALRLNTDLTKLSTKQQSVQESMTRLLAAGDVQRQLEILLEQLSALFPVEHARIVLFGLNAEDPPLILKTSESRELETLFSQTNLLRQLKGERETRRIDFDPGYAPFCTKPTLLVPLATSSEAVGGLLLIIDNKDIDTIESRLLITYTAQAALAVVQSRLIDRIQASQEQLVRSERLAAVGTLAASLAHEFNNILAIISSTAELAALKQECDTHRKSLSLIGMTAKRGGSITRGILTFTRQIEPYRELAQIHDAIEPVLAMLKTRFRDSSVQVVRDFTPVRPLVCDIGLLSQAILNLLTNALDAMHPKGGTLTIKLWEEHDSIKLQVADTGTGIPKGLRDTLFEPFITSKHETNEGLLGGNGLGLAITQGIIASHDGTIEVESEEGRGTAITISLPASKAEAPVSAPVFVGRAPKPLRVMVVDDEPLIAMALAQIVEMDGHQVSWLTDPELALVHISQGPPDLLMADIHMPNLDGITLLQFAKEFAPEMQQILVTGQIDAHQRREVHRLGAELVYKPFSVADIRGVLSRVSGATGERAVQPAAEPSRSSDELWLSSIVERQQINPSISSAVRHQVMNHITALEGFVPILQQALQSPAPASVSLDAPALLCHMARAVGALGVLTRTQRLLYLADYDGKPVVLPVAPVMLYHQIVEAKIRVSTGLLPDERILIQVDCPRDLEIYGNTMSLLTALSAALYNAVEAIGRQGSGDTHQIILSAFQRNDQVVLRIEDSGPGFAPQILQQIAERMDQGQGEQFIATLQPRHGVGLGIAAMVRTARLHGGTIAFGNHASRRGAWVEFTLPKAADLKQLEVIPSENMLLDVVAA
jgi:two-component system, NtrC family, sensor kinase